MTDHRTPAEIERDIERERAGLSQTLDTLQDKLSVESMVRQIGDQFRENGGEIGRNVARSVRDNPLAVAVTGVGLAWLIFGNGSARRTGKTVYFEHSDDHERLSDRYDQPSYRRRSDVGYAPGYTSGARYPSGTGPLSTYRAGDPDWACPDDIDDTSDWRDRLDETGNTVSDAASSAASAVRNGAAATGSAVGNAASKAGSTIGHAASSAGSAVSGAANSAANAARRGKDKLARGASAAGRRIAQGTENLSEEARSRVIAARRRAIEARAATARAAERGSRHAADFYDRQPLVAGLLAMAAGAAVAGALPRTRIEDEYLGEHSDALFEEAERIFREETEKAKRVAKTARDEAAKIARETKDDLDRGAPGEKSAVEAVADKVKADTKRVADAAEREAKKQGLGKPNVN